MSSIGTTRLLSCCVLSSAFGCGRSSYLCPKCRRKSTVWLLRAKRTDCLRLLLGRQCAAAGFSEADVAQSLHELVTVNPGAFQSFEPKMTGGLCLKWPSGTEPDVRVIRSTCRPTISNWPTLIMIERQSVEEVNSSSLDEFIVAEVWAGTLQFIVSAGSLSAPP